MPCQSRLLPNQGHIEGIEEPSSQTCETIARESTRAGSADLAEKALPWGERAARLAGWALVAYGLAVVIAPSLSLASAMLPSQA